MKISKSLLVIIDWRLLSLFRLCGQLHPVFLDETDHEQHNHRDRGNHLCRNRFDVRIQADPIISWHAAQVGAFNKITLDVILLKAPT